MNVPLFDLQPQFAAIRTPLRESLERILDSQQFVLGPEGQALEEEIARYCQTRFAVACAVALICAGSVFGAVRGTQANHEGAQSRYIASVAPNSLR